MLFPEPEGPTMAVVYPAGISKVTFSSIFWYSFGAVGYLKETFLNFIDSLNTISFTLLSLSIILGILSTTSKTILPTTLADITAYKLGNADINVMNPVINAIITDKISPPE